MDDEDVFHLNTIGKINLVNYHLVIVRTSWYNLDINYFKDVYFKRSCKDSCDDKNNEGDNTNNKKCCIPALAQFNKENKKCSNYTKIQQNGTFNNQTLSGVHKCLDNPKCISFEFKKDGINSNVCNLTDACHKLNYNNDNNTDVL